MSEEIVQNKKEFRKCMLARRDALDEQERREFDTLRNRRVLELSAYRKAKLLLAYVSFRSEADTIELIADALKSGKDVAVPRVCGKEMIFYRITELAELSKGYMGILEPKEEAPVADLTKYRPEEIFFVVPGAAFDERGGRIGYGGGFYDRFFETYPNLSRTALAYEVQVTEQVPREEHDAAVDRIITEQRCIFTE